MRDRFAPVERSNLAIAVICFQAKSAVVSVNIINQASVNCLISMPDGHVMCYQAKGAKQAWGFMAVIVTEAIIRVRTSDGARAVGMHEVLFHVQCGSLIDLPGMRADQRASVVTTLAIISHLLPRYSHSPLTTADDWLKALLSQFGDRALVLAGGSDHNRNFCNRCWLVWAK